MSTSYISQQQIQDCVKMGGYRQLAFYDKPFYVNLGAKVFDEKSGKLTDLEQQKKLV